MRLVVMERIWIVLLSLIGIGISFYINYKRSRSERLFCLLGEHCTEVIKSKYAWTFRIAPNEVFGIVYYMVIILMTIFSFPALQSLLVVGSFLVAAFSVYLTYTQLFVLKRFCEWCLAANGVNVILFLLIVF